MRKYILIFLVTFIGSHSAYSFDFELNEARKCINLYRRYEQRLKLPEDTLYAIGLHETSKIHSKHKVPIAWPWTVNYKGKGYYFKSKNEAKDFVKEKIRAGENNIDVGCMQVNLKHHPDAFRSIDQAFTPRYNVSYAANFLVSKYKSLGSWGKAISHYHSSHPTKGKRYKNKVLKIAKNMDKHKSIFKTEKSINYKNRNSSQLAFDHNSKRYKSNMMVEIPKGKET